MIDEKILEVIREALPEKEVGVVRRVFEERDTYKNSSENYKKELEEKSKLLKELIEEKGTVELLRGTNESREAELDEKEKDLANREVNLNKTLAEKETAVLRECFQAVMKVPTIRREIQKNVPVELNGSIYSQSSSEYETRTEE